MKYNIKGRVFLIFVLATTLSCSGVLAQSHDNRGNQKENDREDQKDNNRQDQWGVKRADNRDNRGISRENNRQYNHGERYHYREGRWYKRGWFGWEFAVSGLVIGALVESLPPRHTTVVVDNDSYYYDKNVYYQQLPDGSYIVVQPPVQGSPHMQQSADYLTINIPNSRGGYTAVNIKRSGSGFIGPQGEYYPNMPSVEQLRALYGR
ncbi:MAG: hypothetical protein HQL26_06655 [Candidatus Omnitrophica bacterium]|nr:hypothetical protein [Candidatus Omnitrophota bacterium]